MVRNLENFEVPGSSDAAGGLEEVEGEFFGERLGRGGGHFLRGLIDLVFWLMRCVEGEWDGDIPPGGERDGYKVVPYRLRGTYLIFSNSINVRGECICRLVI